MELLTQIEIRKTSNSKIHSTDFQNPGFGKYISDHMLVCDFANNEWQMPQIVPYSDFSISPSALALHYGQTVFEGMKAFKMDDGGISIFRIQKHYERFVKSLQRMCMAVVPEELFIEGLKQLIKTDRDWVPPGNGNALYIRPFVFASEAKFGIHISEEYRFIIFTGPVSPALPASVKVKVETHFNRAANGATGSTKCGGNYGAALLPTKQAKEEGYNQVLWTDSKENKFIEESGMMNVMFLINGVLVTPPLSDSILDGVTRDSLLAIAKNMGIETDERKVSVDELKEGIKNGSVTEAFGAGTAALVSPISTIGIEGIDYNLPSYDSSSVMFTLKAKLDDIRYGRAEDVFHWNFII